MNKKLFIIINIFLFVGCLLVSFSTVNAMNQNEVVLTGRNLTIDKVINVAKKEAAVKISSEAIERVKKSHQLLLKAAQQGRGVYGLNVGVGLNKDVEIFEGDTMVPEIRRASEKFNKKLLRSHSGGINPSLEQEVVRATMLIRLNTMLFGCTGTQAEVVEMYAKFLNNKIHPVVPSRGSTGESDIGILPHIGLAMVGEGNVFYNGEKMSASQALKKANLEPVSPYAKDALSILSSNAYSAAKGVLVIDEVERMLKTADLVYAMSLEGLNGNISPLLESVQKVRPYDGQNRTARRLRKYLKGSYLWDSNEERALQDPLSFRDYSHVQGSVQDILNFTKKQLNIQLNSSDDNPGVILSAKPENNKSQVREYYVESEEVFGMVAPTANFEPVSWVLGFESLGVALNHISNMSSHRLIKLQTNGFTGLPRFLGEKGSAYGLGILQNASTSLNSEINNLSNPSSTHYYAVSGAIEDRGTNAPAVVERIRKLTDNLYYILAMEFISATQAIEFRKRKTDKFHFSNVTKEIYKEYRQVVPFIDHDQKLTDDIEKSYKFLKDDQVINAAQTVLE